MGKNYKLYSIGDKVIITAVNNNDPEQIKLLNKIGVITEVRHSFCKVDIDGKIWNKTYKQFKKI